MTRRLSGFLGLGLICLAGLILGQNVALADSVQMTLTAPPSGGVLWNNQVYVDPYTATINGVQSVPVICDDFTDDTYSWESWTANVFRYNGSITSLESTAPTANTFGSAAGYAIPSWLIGP